MTEKPLFEDQDEPTLPDPEETPVKDRKLVAQPYDIVVEALIQQIKTKTLHARPFSNRPRFQRHYIWSDELASRLIESILLNVPIPPCYLSQNDDFELDVIDGQQRIYSVYRYIENQFKLSNLEVLPEYNGKSFFELPIRAQRMITTHTLRCVLITRDSHPEIKFEVFERLNTNTVPLNSQELRNCVFRGALIDLLAELAEFSPWLRILGKKEPDKRMRGEELILRFFAFNNQGIDGYRTPQKHWLNDTARLGQRLDAKSISDLRELWKSTINKSLIVFDEDECFRRPKTTKKRTNVVNRALMDLVMFSFSKVSEQTLKSSRQRIRSAYETLINDEEFSDLIRKSIDHKSRTKRRFELWQKTMLV